MHLNSIFIKHFRCFAQKKIEFDAKSVLLIGPNGSGKTSILEAIYYCNHLKSFKSNISTELIHTDTLGFNLELNFESEKIALGFWDKKKSIKLNDKSAKGHKDIYAIFKVLAITADDIFLIQGSPELRRNFLDQTALLIDLNYAQILKEYKIVLQNRNALLYNWNGCIDSYKIWSEKLYKLSIEIQKTRKSALEFISIELNSICLELGLDIAVELNYIVSLGELADLSEAQPTNDQLVEILERIKANFSQELSRKRTLFGAHLDDLQIILNNKNAKTFASRGQQKLLVFLLKLAQMQAINKKTNSKSIQIFLIDDFVSDLDNDKIEKIILLAQKLAHQIFITHPTDSGFIVDLLKEQSAQIYYLI